jgi:hypothetical protein
MEVSGQLDAPAALPPWKEPLVRVEQEAGWAVQPVWTTWKREHFLTYRYSNSDPSVVQPKASHNSDSANPAPS